MKIQHTFVILIISFLLFGNTAYSQFGKNKVQYERFNWKYVSTRNFDIYFHEDGKELADYTAVEAEKALDKIQQEINYKLSSRITFLVFNSHNQFQQNNVISQFLSEGVGGVTQLFKNRIVIPFQGKYDQFQHVIFHELVHGVLNDMFHGGTLRNSMRDGGFFIPLWLNEGLCEYLSHGGMNAETDMFMRDLAIEEKIPELNRISGYLAYRAGQTFYWYIAEKYGKEKVGEFVNKLKILKNVDRAFESSFKMNVEDFSERWRRDLKRYYLPDLEHFKDIDEFAEPVTSRKKMGNYYNSAPAVSPDGEKLAFITEENGLLKIAVMDIDKPESARSIVSSFRAQDFEDLNLLAPGISWNPQGTKIAISAKAGPEDAVFLVDEKTGKYQKLLFGLKSIESVVWSPDGEKLAFSASVGPQSDIFTYHLKTKKLENITNDIFSDLNPVWSPDSQTLYFISDRGIFTNPNDFRMRMFEYDTHHSDVYRIPLNTRIIERLTKTPEYKKYSIAIDPYENRVLYVSDKNGIGNIYELNLNNMRSTPKTNSITGITQLSLTPDGSKLLFGAQVNGGYDIYMMKFPFEMNLGLTELPLTKFRMAASEQQEMLEKIIEEKKMQDAKEDALLGFGNFDIDTQDQKLVAPNFNLPMQVYGEESWSKNIDTTFEAKDYKLKFTPDLVTGMPSFNTFFGFMGAAQMMFSDELGDHKMFVLANLLFDIKNSTFFFAYNYLPDIVDYQFSAFHSAGFFGEANELNRIEFIRFRNFGFGTQATYATDLFNRFELGANYMNISKTNIDNPSVPIFARNLILGKASYVHDNSLMGWYAPNRGSRFKVSMQGTPKLGENGMSFLTVDADIRGYLPITNWVNLAGRLSGARSLGPNPQKFFLGGTDNWINPRFNRNTDIFQNPEDFAFMNFITPMRGFAINAITGSQYYMANAELRFPLFTALIAGPVPILLQGIMGSFFLDVGTAFNDSFRMHATDINGNKQYQDLLMSSGIGVRSFLMGLPLKLDIAWTKTYSGWTAPLYMFSIGFDY